MPRLDELFQMTKGKIFINLEIKDNRKDVVFPVLVEYITKYDMFDQMELSSFNHGYYDLIKEYNGKHEKKIVFGFLYKKGKGNVEDLKLGFPLNTLNIYREDVTKEKVDLAHKNNMAVMAWFKMKDNDNEDTFNNLLDMGVDAICTNEPVKAREAVERYYSNKSNSCNK